MINKIRDLLNKPYITGLLIIVLSIFSGIFSILTSYNLFKSILLFESFPLFLLLIILSHSKIQKAITCLIVFFILYISLKPSDIVLPEVLILIFLVIVLLFIYFNKRLNK
jgi:hypothetical protein